MLTPHKTTMSYRASSRYGGGADFDEGYDYDYDDRQQQELQQQLQQEELEAHPQPAFEDRYQLTPEQEDEEVEGIKQQIRFTKQESLASTENALRVAAQAEETGRATLLNLGQQSDQLANTERHIEMASINTRRAEDKARKLKQLNRSMFAIHVSKPWGRKKRVEEEEERIRVRHEQERAQLDANRQYAYASQRRVDDALQPRASAGGAPWNRLGPNKGKKAAEAAQQASVMERARYQFEPDEEDDAMEKQLDKNLDALSHAAGRLHGLAQATNVEVLHQNKKLDDLQDKSDVLDTNMYMNTQRINRIR